MEKTVELLVGKGSEIEIIEDDFIVGCTYYRGILIRGRGVYNRLSIFVEDSMYHLISKYAQKQSNGWNMRMRSKTAKMILVFRDLAPKKLIQPSKVERGFYKMENVYCFSRATFIRVLTPQILYDACLHICLSNPSYTYNTHDFEGVRSIESEIPKKYSLHIKYNKGHTIIFTGKEMKDVDSLMKIIDSPIEVDGSILFFGEVKTAEGQVHIASETKLALEYFQSDLRQKAKVALELRCLMSVWEFEKCFVSDIKNQFCLKFSQYSTQKFSYYRENEEDNTFPQKDYRLRILKTEKNEKPSSMSSQTSKTSLPDLPKVLNLPPNIIHQKKPKESPTNAAKLIRTGLKTSAAPFRFEDRLLFTSDVYPQPTPASSIYADYWGED